MVSAMDDGKRVVIAQKLADMRAIQELLIANEKRLLNLCGDAKICDRFHTMLVDDEQNLATIDATISEYGIASEPTTFIADAVHSIQESVTGAKRTLFEQVLQHHLVKQQQLMLGTIIDTSVQTVGADIATALMPLRGVNNINHTHQEQLKGILEILGVRELTGIEPDQNLWQRVEDTIATLSSTVEPPVTATSESNMLRIEELIHLDHQTIDHLFLELETLSDSERLQGRFIQLYKELTVHAEAEEETVYPALRPIYGDDNVQDRMNEQAEMKILLYEMRVLSPTSPEFKEKLQDLKKRVLDHAQQEESTMFSSIRNQLDNESNIQLASQFKITKNRLQNEVDAAMKANPVDKNRIF